MGPQAAEAGVREKVRVTPGMTLAHMTQLIMPQHANSLGITFGGQVRLPAIYMQNPTSCPNCFRPIRATCALQW